MKKKPAPQKPAAKAAARIKPVRKNVQLGIFLGILAFAMAASVFIYQFSHRQPATYQIQSGE